MPRLFTGIEIPPPAIDALAQLRGGLPRARWIDAANYHLTLRFIGDINSRTAAEIAEMLARVRRRSFTLRVGSLASFGSKRPHAIIAVGCVLKGETPQYAAIGQAVAQGLVQVSVTARIPVTFGVIIADSTARARARAGRGSGNRGAEAAQAALAMAQLLKGHRQGRARAVGAR